MRKIFILILVWCTGIQVFGQPVRQLAKSAGTGTQFTHSPYIVVFDSTKVDMAESGLSYSNEHRLVKIMNAAGARQWASYRYDYDPLSAYVEIKKIIIYHSTGQTTELTNNSEQIGRASCRERV